MKVLHFTLSQLLFIKIVIARGAKLKGEIAIMSFWIVFAALDSDIFSQENNDKGF